MSEMHVKLRVGGEAYALPVENVREVAELGQVAPVPGTGASVVGVQNLHGQVLPVFDLGVVLGIRRGEGAPRVVVAEHNGALAGLAVDEVTDVAPLAGEPETAELELLTGAVLEDGGLVGLVDVARMFEALERAAV
jgi:purine-binding chemotaxis protein CheW